MAVAGVAVEEKGKDWSELPTDLLVLILKRLPIVDYIQFGAVCKAWNLPTKSRLCLPAPQIPWLMFPARDDDGLGGCDYQSFFDMCTNKTYIMRLPELHGRQCLGTSADGNWVVFLREDLQLGLLNILARGQQQPLPLPSLDSLWNFKGPVHDDEGQFVGYLLGISYDSEHTFSAEDMLAGFFRKAIVFHISSAAKTPVVAFIHGLRGTVSVARVGDAAWTGLDTPVDTSDVVFHRGRLITVDRGENIYAFELCNAASFTWSTAKQLVLSMDRNPYCRKYLVPLSNGGDDDLFLVSRFADDIPDPVTGDPGVVRTLKVTVSRLNLLERQWVEVKHLAGYTFFLGHNHSVALPAREFPQLKRDCIYFTDDNMESMLADEESRFADRDLGVFSIAGENWDGLPLPGAIVNFPSPIWVTLSLV